MRGIAALSVLILHLIEQLFNDRVSCRDAPVTLFAQLPFPQFIFSVVSETIFNGRSAVQFFFVLSGFVLGSGLKKDFNLFILPSFLAKRFFRLMPPIWSAILFAVLLRLIFQHQPFPGIGTFVGFLTLRDLSIDLVLWSMVVEIAASLVYLPIFFIVVRLSPALQILGLFVAYEIHFIGNFPISWSDFAYTFPLLQFYCGMIVGGAGRMLVTNMGKTESHLLAILSLLVLILPDASSALLGLSPHLPEGFNYWNHWFLNNTPFAVPAAALFLIAYVAFGECVSLRSLLNHHVLKLLGGMSYSLYLVHLPMIELTSVWIGHIVQDRGLRLALGAITVMPPAFAIAYLNWRIVEGPSNATGRALARRIQEFFSSTFMPAAVVAK
jgi:peptidoglycan/LPS O-acetylase OafA/YrhL